MLLINIQYQLLSDRLAAFNSKDFLLFREEGQVSGHFICQISILGHVQMNHLSHDTLTHMLQLQRKERNIVINQMMIYDTRVQKSTYRTRTDIKKSHLCSKYNHIFTHTHTHIYIYIYTHYIAKSIGSPLLMNRFDYFSNYEYKS